MSISPELAHIAPAAATQTLAEPANGHVAEVAIFPTRVVPLGETKCAYSFTMFKPAAMPDELFESQYESLRREFDNIRRRFADVPASCAR